MNRLHPVVVVLFLGGLSILTGAAPDHGFKRDTTIQNIEINSDKQVEVIGKIIELVEQTVSNVSGIGRAVKTEGTLIHPQPGHTLGLAQIIEFQKGVICSGILLKPWIVLTTADCMEGRDITKLIVQITRHEKGKDRYYRHDVEIQKVTRDPDFRPGLLKKNFAMLYIYSRFEWIVDEFVLPNYMLTPEKALAKNIKTYTQRWRSDKERSELYPIIEEKPLAEDYSYCGELDTIEDEFCAEKKEGMDTLNKEDMATPLFYFEGKLKRLIGMFSGRNFNEPIIAGHLYQSVSPFLDWIEQYMHEHSLPPFTH